MKLTKKATHSNPATVSASASTGPDWSRARRMLADIKTLVRLTIGGQILFGRELQTLKIELGFAGRGGDRRSKPNARVWKSDTRTWQQWCESELGISVQGADNFIACFEAAKLKLKDGGDTKLLTLMQTHPAKLSEKQCTALALMVDKIHWADTQRELLESLRIFKLKDTSGIGGSTSKTKPEKTAQQLAFAFFGGVEETLAEAAKAAENARLFKDFKRYLATLPLVCTEKGQVSLSSLEASYAALVEGDAAKTLAAIRDMKAKLLR